MSRRFLLILVFVIFSSQPSLAEKINGLEVEWGSTSTYTLSWTNPSVNAGDYTINVTDFNWMGDAAVSVTRLGENRPGILSEGYSTVFDFTKDATSFRGIRITANKVSNYQVFPPDIGTYPCCPAAEIKVEVSTAITEKKPELELSLSQNWDGRSGLAFVMNIEIKNTGDADFSGGNVTINTGGLQLAVPEEISDNALTYNPSKGTVTRRWSTLLSAGSSYHFDLSLKSPLVSNKSTFTISAVSYFKDLNGTAYFAEKSVTVSAKPSVELIKRITPSTIIGERTYGDVPEGYIGLGKITVVNINVKNIQTYPLKNINLTDNIIEDFILLNDTISPGKDFREMGNNKTLRSIFDLNASETKEFRYVMIAQRIGTYTAPASSAHWSEWGEQKSVSSELPGTRVYGVFVQVSKIIDKKSLKLNESFNVTLKIENVGDFPVGINVTDVIPKNATFVSGVKNFRGYLFPAGSVSFTYNLSTGGNLEFPSPEITFQKNEYNGSYKFTNADNITLGAALPDNAGNDVQDTSRNTNLSTGQNIAFAPQQTHIPKGLIDIIGEKAPWIEGAIPIIMLLVAVTLMLMLHVVNR